MLGKDQQRSCSFSILPHQSSCVDVQLHVCFVSAVKPNSARLLVPVLIVCEDPLLERRWHLRITMGRKNSPAMWTAGGLLAGARAAAVIKDSSQRMGWVTSYNLLPLARQTQNDRSQRRTTTAWHWVYLAVAVQVQARNLPQPEQPRTPTAKQLLQAPFFWGAQSSNYSFSRVSLLLCDSFGGVAKLSETKLNLSEAGSKFRKKI